MLPDPEVEPVVDVWPTAGQACKLGRSATYEAAKRGDIPTIRLGRRIVVPTARLRALLGLDSDGLGHAAAPGRNRDEPVPPAA